MAQPTLFVCSLACGSLLRLLSPFNAATPPDHTDPAPLCIQTHIMGGSSYVLTEEAYLTVLLHAAKYPSCSVCGVLLGQSRGGGQVTVEAAVPLFHISQLLAPCVDTGLSQAEAFAQQRKLQLIGFYDAEARMNAQDMHPVGKRIADRLAERQPDTFVLLLDNQKLAAFSRQGSTTPPFELLLRDSPGSKGGSWKRVAAGSSAGELGLPAGSSWEALRARFLNMHAKQLHRQLADFDEHLDDVSKDFTNQQLFSGATAVLER